MHSYRGFLLSLLSALFATAALFITTSNSYAQQPSQRAVEDVQIIGNRRLRREDLLYYIQTRPGDPFNADQIQRDLQTLLQLGFFDKVATRVYTGEGPRWGVVVVFELNERRLIPDLEL